MTSASDAIAGLRYRAFEAAVDSLTRKASGTADRAIDWSLEPVPPRWTSRRAYVDAVSQLLHAEHATREACANLSKSLDDPASRRFVESQARDEARHAALYTRYLDRLGDVAPVDEALEAALEGALRWRGRPAAMMIAYNVVLEGEAVALLGAAARVFPCPLLGRIVRTVGSDEARHTAFGQIYLTRALADRGVEERRAIYRDVRALWRAIARPRPGDGTAGTLLRRGWRGYLAARWQVQDRTLRRIGLIRPGENFER